MSFETTSKRSIFIGGILIIFAIIFLTQVGRMWENVDAEEVAVIQSPIEGRLDVYVTAGLKWQGLGSVTKYSKRDIYILEDNSVRFNDGGHAKMEGSVQWEMPLDVENIIKIHTKYGSQEAVQNELINTVVDKCIYFAGPLMSSKESYAEKRNDLIRFIEDQIENGVYRTRSKDIKAVDPMTGVEKTVTQVEIMFDSNGMALRQEEAILPKFGINTYNFSISRLPYDEAVEGQIKQQQQITMDVQTAMADAKKAEQRTITVIEQGKANAATAKWEQEVLKAKFVTEAEQKLEVAKLETKAAEQYKLAQILRAEGDAEYKRKIMQADGALTQKLSTYEKVNEMYAQAISSYQGAWVSQFNMGASNQNINGAEQLINLFTVKTARDLADIQNTQLPVKK